MSETSNVDSIASQVERNLPALRDQDREELYAEVSELALQDARFAAPLPQEARASLGRALVDRDERIRNVVCNNKNVISGAIDATNVTALAALLGPALGFPPIAIPGAVVALSVLLLKIGLNQYCKEEEVAADAG